MAAEHEVVEHRHVGEQLDVLERARDADGRDLVRPAPRQLVLSAGGAVKQDAPALRPVEAADAVEQAGLAGAVGADDGHDLAVVDVEAHAVERGDAAEGERDRLDLKRSGGLARCCADESPAAVEP